MTIIRKGIENVLATADRYGFKRHREDGTIDREAVNIRHGMMNNFHEAQAEFRRLVQPPIENAYNQREIEIYYSAMIDHCTIKAITYLNKRIDRTQRKENDT